MQAICKHVGAATDDAVASDSNISGLIAPVRSGFSATLIFRHVKYGALAAVNRFDPHRLTRPYRRYPHCPRPAWIAYQQRDV
jgi:hypothetical protein